MNDDVSGREMRRFDPLAPSRSVKSWLPKLAALRAALIEGEESGISSRSVHDIWAAVKERHAARG